MVKSQKLDKILLCIENDRIGTKLIFKCLNFKVLTI